MLWLDGGWIRPKQLKNPSWVNSPFNQDIDMKSLAALARKNQPGLLIVDRSVGGEFENYQTPEQHIPSQHEILPYPWETCMTMGNSWSYVPNDQYKSSKTILNNLCTVVSRGGNYLLNIGPSPNGDWDIQAYQKLEEIAEWMKVNERAIFNTTRAKISESEHYFYTQKNDTVFAIFFSDSLNQFPTHFPIEWPQKPGLVQLLGGDFPVNYEWIKEGMTWTISKSDRSKLQNLPAICFYFIPEH
jgi:alpha-L-fucosidase